jgi:hypothetical protein
VKSAPGEFELVRRLQRTEEDLLRQVAQAPELTLDTGLYRDESVRLLAVAQMHERAQRSSETASLNIFEERPDLRGLPFRKGAACKLAPEAARRLEKSSIVLRGWLSGALRASLRAQEAWHEPEAIPTLRQILTVEDEMTRDVLVDQLAAIKGSQASQVLAERALYELHPRVRKWAVSALRQRLASDYLPVLVRGFEHPWPAVAEHAAEAIASLRIAEAVPRLLALLEAPDPRSPQQRPGQGHVVREMVRINHLANCLMCHAPSLRREDLVRGRIPVRDEALPSPGPVPARDQPRPSPPSPRYYASPPGEEEKGIFVRADVTYLKQDFSVHLEVKSPGAWPAKQRFDFLVRERPATRTEIMNWITADRDSPTDYQELLMFALRELTGLDPGPTVADWKRYADRRDLLGGSSRMSSPSSSSARGGAGSSSSSTNCISTAAMQPPRHGPAR